MGKPRWQREVIQDHKFDFIDVKSFTAHSVLLWIGYAWVLIDVFKSIAVYAIDTETAIFLLAFNKWASSVKPAISPSISRWIFSGCIIFSFLLLVKDWYTARKIIRSRDISFAYTNLIANRWYSIRGGYAYFCLFDRLGDARNAWDSIAFFIFFSFKGWKRLLLAEGPRQVLNAMALYSVAKDNNFSFDLKSYQVKYTTFQGVVMSFMLLTVAIWALSFLRLLVAGLLYFPLLCCHIRGNLKEYCCHKVDKRISQILIEKRRKRDQKLEKKGTMPVTETLDSKYQPTLPKVELDSDGDSVISMPLYALSRTDTGDSRRHLLTRTDSSSTVGTQRYLPRTNDARPAGLTRTNTEMSDRPGLPRQPTLPHLVSDFSVPERPRPSTPRSLPRLDTSSPPPRPTTSNSVRSSPYGPPQRNMTASSVVSRNEPSTPWSRGTPSPGVTSPRGYAGSPRRPEQVVPNGYPERSYSPYNTDRAYGNGYSARGYPPPR